MMHSYNKIHYQIVKYLIIRDIIHIKIFDNQKSIEIKLSIICHS